MARGDLVTMQWAWMAALSRLASAPSTNFPPYVYLSQSDVEPTHLDPSAQWVEIYFNPLPLPDWFRPMPMTGYSLDNTTPGCVYVRWTTPLVWTPSIPVGNPSFPNPYVVRSVVYQTTPRNSAPQVMGVMRLTTPVEIWSAGGFTLLPTWPLGSRVLTG